ncbi:chaperonin 10-like protein [Mycena rebaudengoi]|nr:chaperonin 10-like protein [Mycena rebaudengoi]
MAASTIPDTYQAFRRTAGALPLTFEKTTENIPTLAPNDVLIRIHAVSLNFRDIAMLDGRYPAPSQERGIAASDCAAVVVAVGDGAAKEFGFEIGEHVAPIFNLASLTGEEDHVRALGGDSPGVLREYAVFEGRHLVRLPKDMSWEEASTIACAGVTAWTALSMPTPAIKGGKRCAIFALLICLAADIHPIITSSSDTKLAEVRKLAPEGKTISTINYATHPNWAVEAKHLTGGKGVDYIVDNDVDALAHGGTISLVGFLAGLEGDVPASAIMTLLAKKGTIQGIAVGSRLDFQNLNNWLEEKGVRLSPLIDKVFSFDDSIAAFDYLHSAKHVGKVVIKL